MNFKIENCDKKHIEQGIQNAFELGLFGTLDDDALKQLQKVRVQTRGWYFFEDLYCQTQGEYDRTNRIITISRTCPEDWLAPVVLHETIHALEDSFRSDKHYDEDWDVFMESCRKQQAREAAYQAELDEYLRDNMGSDFDELENVNCLFQWAFDRFGLYGHRICTEDFLCHHGNLFWHLSLKCDIMLGWPLGTTMQYGSDEAVKDILAGKLYPDNPYIPTYGHV